LIFDFTYFSKQDAFEANIQRNIEISDLDEEFREIYTNVLEQFYLLFRSIYHYINDYKKLINELNSGKFINIDIKNAVSSQSSCALLAEGLAQYGVMLLILDIIIPGPVREGIIVSYYRYRGKSAIQNMNDIIKICANTTVATGKGIPAKPPEYPVEYFARYKINQEIVKSIVHRIKDDDMYQQMNAYPSGNHRTVAFSNQASLLYILLFFIPSMLRNETDDLRDIVNKHFGDNWVITYFQGFIVDLFESWKKFKGANAVLERTITVEKVKELVTRYKNEEQELSKALTTKVMERLLQENDVLNNSEVLFNQITSTNVTIRWMMLHRNTKKFHEIISPELNVNQILHLILTISEFESQFKVVQTRLIENKQTMFDDTKIKCLQYMTECSEYFAGNRNLGQVTINPQYSEYFKNIGGRINNLKCRSSKTPQSIQNFTNSLNTMATYPVVSANHQIKYYITETVSSLMKLAKIASLRKDSLSRLALISDFSYAWNLMDDYFELMHKRIKSDTKAVMLFRACFMKLGSILNQPLRRIIELNNEEMLMTVSRFYSNQLVSFVGKVLAVIPTSIYKLLEEMTSFMTVGLKAQEAKITKEDLLSYAQFNERFQLAERAHKISLFVEGMLKMNKCIMGIIEVDPKELLINGIKNEMMLIVTKTLNNSLIFKKELTTEAFEATIKQTAARLDNMRTALEYVQDIMGIDALSIWLEQMTRLINFYATRETMVRSKQKTFLGNEDEKLIPIPVYEPIDGSPTFLGRLVTAMLNITSPNKPLSYFPSCNAWFDNNGNFVFGSKTIRSLILTFGVVGVNGLDKLISHDIGNNINLFARVYKQNMDSTARSHIENIKKETKNGCISELTEALKNNIDKSVSSLGSMVKAIIPYLDKIGRLQLHRKIIQQLLMQLARVDSKGFYQVVSNLNRCSLQYFMERKSEEPPKDNQGYSEMKSLRSKEVKFLNFVSSLTDTMGLSNPLHKIYIYPKFEMYSLPHMLAILTIDYLKGVTYNKTLSMFMRKRIGNDFPDPQVLLAGIVTILNHMHIKYLGEYMVTLSFYIKLTTAQDLTKKKKQRIDPISSNINIWFNEYCKMTGQPRDIINKISSSFVFDTFPYEV